MKEELLLLQKEAISQEEYDVARMNMLYESTKPVD
jgi:hypothetical protein